MTRNPLLNRRSIFAALVAVCWLALPAQSLTHSHADGLFGGESSLETSLPGAGGEVAEVEDCVLCIQGQRHDQDILAPELAEAAQASCLQLSLHPESASGTPKHLTLHQAARAPPHNA